METRTREKGTIDHRLWGSIGTLVDANPTRLSKRSQSCPLTITVVDAVSKRVHFIPTHTTVTAEGAACLFLHYVWKLHSLAPPDRQTNGTHQPRAWPVPLPIHQRTTEWLVRPPTYCRVPAQQLRSFCDATISVPTKHRTNPLYGFWAKTEPL